MAAAALVIDGAEPGKPPDPSEVHARMKGEVSVGADPPALARKLCAIKEGLPGRLEALLAPPPMAAPTAGVEKEVEGARSRSDSARLVMEMALASRSDIVLRSGRSPVSAALRGADLSSASKEVAADCEEGSDCKCSDNFMLSTILESMVCATARKTSAEYGL